MMELNKSVNLLLFFIIGALLILGWISIAVPILKNNSTAFENIREYIGKDSYAKNIGDELSKPVISKDFVEYKIISTDGNILEIESAYITSDIITNEKIYENHETYFVNSATRKHANDDSLYFIFPTNVQKQSYRLLDPNMEVPTAFNFEEAKYIDDLEVFVFSCVSLGDDFSDAWPEFAPEPIFGDQSCKVSIEPVTGKTVQFSINWDMYAVKNGIHTSVELGNAETTSFTERILLQSAKETKLLFYLYDFVIPTFLILLHISIFLVILYNNKSKEKGKIIIRQLEELQKTEKIKTIGHLSSRLSHDIRNPLTVIKTSMAILKKSNADFEPKYGKLFTAVDKAILRIEHQVNNVLDFIQRRPLKLEEISMDVIIDSALDDIAIPNNIQIEKITTDAKIICDQHMITIVFLNILGNAKHAIGDNEGKIRIQVDDKENMLKITISNNGEAIPDDVLSKIFEPLFTTKQEGTGLGLASCKSIVEQHGGTISVKNNPTTFTILIPKNPKN